MNDVLLDYLDHFCTAYLDDILIYSEDPLEHETHVKLVLDRLRKAGLQADIKKSEFSVTRTKYLGYIVSTNGLEIDPVKTEPLRNWQYPTTVREVRGFLGFTGFYRRFIRDYSVIAKPLHHLTKDNVPFQFDEDCRRAFRFLRDAILSPEILCHYQPDYPTMIETDASDGVVCGILKQKQLDGEWHPIAFYSHTMSAAECNYEIHDKELLAIVQAFDEWRSELASCHKTIEVFSDHKALEYFMTTKLLTSRQVRWAEALAQYNFLIMYRSGRLNGQADALSRRSQETSFQERLMKDNRTTTLLTADRLHPEVVRDLEESQEALSVASFSPLVTDSLPLVDELLQANKAIVDPPAV